MVGKLDTKFTHRCKITKRVCNNVKIDTLKFFCDFSSIFKHTILLQFSLAFGLPYYYCLQSKCYYLKRGWFFTVESILVIVSVFWSFSSKVLKKSLNFLPKSLNNYQILNRVWKITKHRYWMQIFTKLCIT